MFEIECEDLGIRDCDFHIEGKTPADAIEQVRAYLREHNHLDLPDTDDILDGEYKLENLDEGVDLIITRLRHELSVTPGEAPRPERIVPPVVPSQGTTIGGRPYNW